MCPLSYTSLCVFWDFFAWRQNKNIPKQSTARKKHLSLHTGSVFSMPSMLCCSVTQSYPTLCDPMDCSTPGFPVLHHLAVCSDSCPLSQWCHPTISPSVVPFSSCLQSFPASGLFQWFSSLHQVAKVLELQLQHQSFQWIFRTHFLWDRPVGSPCSPRDCQESSPTPQIKSMSLAFSLLYGPTLTSIHDYWKNHSFY